MVLLLTITMMDIGAGGNDKDTWKRIGTHAGAFPPVATPFGGGYVGKKAMEMRHASAATWQHVRSGDGPCSCGPVVAHSPQARA